MQIVKDKLWTWLLPDVERIIDRDEWSRYGGKWIIFDSKDSIVEIAQGLDRFIDSGEIQSAKYWNGDPSAINVYSLDRDKQKSWEILRQLGAKQCRVWEYDYAWDKNISSPLSFLYSWSSKFRTIIQSYGLRGTVQLIRELLSSK